jgi:ketosteroid isomerase-like protein
MNSVEENMRLMKTLDDAWNAQDWDTFDSRHAKNVAVYWPGQPEPTRGGPAHRAESIEFFKTYPDNHIDNDPYKVLFGQGEWTCSVARFTGTMKGPMKGPDGTMIAPTNKKFEVEFCTVAHWQNGKIVEERLFYDLVGLMRQIGLG